LAQVNDKQAENLLKQRILAIRAVGRDSSKASQVSGALAKTGKPLSGINQGRRHGHERPKAHGQWMLQDGRQGGAGREAGDG